MARRSAVIGLAAVLSSACGAPRTGPGADAVVDTLPTGALHVRYAALPDEPVLDIQPDLTIGTVGGEGPAVFGDIRSVDAASDGTIYVLDTQAVEIRVFDADGRHLRTLGGRGEGPGEIIATNGIQLLGDSLLWVNDYGKGSLLALAPDGAELERRPMPVRSFGYVWSGTIDREGRFWRPDFGMEGQPGQEPEPGLHEEPAVHHMVRANAPWATLDSIVFAEVPLRSMVFTTGSGWSFFQIPFDPRPTSAVDPDGGFWATPGATYALARHDANGELLVRVEAGVSPPPVSDLDRTTYLERYEGSPDRLRAAEAVADVMPDRKGVIETLTVDDAGHLWVGRPASPGEGPRYDVFARDGRFVAAVRLGFEPTPSIPIRIRHGHVYAVTRDSLDVPHVLRAPVPTEVRP